MTENQETSLDNLTADFQELSAKEDCEKMSSQLLQKATVLLQELEEFRLYIAAAKTKPIEFRHFRGAVDSEMKTLKKHSKGLGSAKTAHALRSSNFLFYASVWDIAKQCTGIVAMRKVFYWLPNSDAVVNRNCGKVPSGTRDRQYSAPVDIVADDGLEWIKVSTIPSRRVLYDLAKSGWVQDDSPDEDGDSGLDFLEDDDEPEGLLKQAQSLKKASRATRIRYRHPRIRLILTRIIRGEIKEVDLVIQLIEKMDITVQTADQIKAPPALDAELMSSMAVNPYSCITNTINIDCTMLLAFASDLSHSRNVEEEDWHIQAIKKQIELERKDQLLPNTLWPICGTRKMVCTREAVQRMHEIVDLIGTDTEKQRTRFLMDDDPTTKELTREGRLLGLQTLSEYQVPKDWQLPLITVDCNMEELQKKIAAPASLVEEVKASLLEINQAIFLYGWATGITTISSNGAVAKKIESTIEENRTSEDDQGPLVWLCATSRSLLAKEKERRGYPRPQAC